MKLLALIAIVAIIGVIVGIYFKKKQSRQSRETASSEASMPHSFSYGTTTKDLSAKKIQPGWRVMHPELGPTSCVVVGVVTFVQDGKYYWYELFVERADESLVWLSAEEDESRTGAWNYARWEEVDRNSYERRSSKIIYDGFEFTQSESGEAKFSVKGRTNIGVESGTVKFRDYKSKDGTRLFSVETYDGPSAGDDSTEASAGIVINTAFLEISPPGE